MKAFEHISQTIDPVYKELTKGKASPMGGVAYLSLEESDVSEWCIPRIFTDISSGTLSGWCEVSRNASYEAFPGHGTTVGR
jgi:chromosome segregation ATPase